MRLKVNKYTNQNIASITEDIQLAVEQTVSNHMNTLISQYGIISGINNNHSGTNDKILSVSAGRACFPPNLFSRFTTDLPMTAASGFTITRFEAKNNKIVILFQNQTASAIHIMVSTDVGKTFTSIGTSGITLNNTNATVNEKYDIVLTDDDIIYFSNGDGAGPTSIGTGTAQIYKWDLRNPTTWSTISMTGITNTSIIRRLDYIDGKLFVYAKKVSNYKTEIYYTPTSTIAWTPLTITGTALTADTAAAQTRYESHSVGLKTKYIVIELASTAAQPTDVLKLSVDTLGVPTCESVTSSFISSLDPGAIIVFDINKNGNFIHTEAAGAASSFSIKNVDSAGVVTTIQSTVLAPNEIAYAYLDNSHVIISLITGNTIYESFDYGQNYKAYTNNEDFLQLRAVDPQNVFCFFDNRIYKKISLAPKTIDFHTTKTYTWPGTLLNGTIYQVILQHKFSEVVNTDTALNYPGSFGTGSFKNYDDNYNLLIRSSADTTSDKRYKTDAELILFNIQGLTGDVFSYTPNTVTTTARSSFSSYFGAGIFNNLISSGTATLSTVNISGLLTSNGQVAFPATQNASADPNILDDYEEGTFIPTISSGLTSVTYTEQTGIYTKIGRLVYFKAVIDLSSTPTGTANRLEFAGLPYSAGATENPVSYIDYGNNLVEAGDSRVLVTVYDTNIYFRRTSNASGLVDFKGNELNSLATFNITVAGCYNT